MSRLSRSVLLIPYLDYQHFMQHSTRDWRPSSSRYPILFILLPHSTNTIMSHSISSVWLPPDSDFTPKRIKQPGCCGFYLIWRRCWSWSVWRGSYVALRNILYIYICIWWRFVTFNCGIHLHWSHAADMIPLEADVDPILTRFGLKLYNNGN